ncbi:unnamed protein product, partial [Didymodactylos carnosus]
DIFQRIDIGVGIDAKADIRCKDNLLWRLIITYVLDLRMCVTKDDPTSTDDLFDVSDDETDNTDNDTNNEPAVHVTEQHSEMMIDKEVELNTANSEFRTELLTIYYECLHEKGYSKNSITKTKEIICENLQRLAYLTSNFMPSDLTRYRREVKLFDNMILKKDAQRTTADSESRMGILKRTQPGTT